MEKRFTVGIKVPAITLEALGVNLLDCPVFLERFENVDVNGGRAVALRYMRAIKARKFEAAQSIAEKYLQGIKRNRWDSRDVISADRLPFFVDACPPILADYPEVILVELRDEILLEQLFVLRDRSSRWEERKRAKNAIRFTARHHANLAQIKKVCKFVEINVAGTDYPLGHEEYITCAACLPFAGRLYSVFEVPELPHIGCTNKYGCRCMMLGFVPYGPTAPAGEWLRYRLANDYNRANPLLGECIDIEEIKTPAQLPPATSEK